CAPRLTSGEYREVCSGCRKKEISERGMRKRPELFSRSWGRHSCLPRTSADRNVCPTTKVTASQAKPGPRLIGPSARQQAGVEDELRACNEPRLVRREEHH